MGVDEPLEGNVSSSGLRKKSGIAAAALALVVLAGACDLVEPPTLINVGHVDAVDVELENGELGILVHDEVNNVEYDPATVVLQAAPGTETTIPAGPAYAFLGTAGAPVWILPQIQDPTLLWLGWGAEEILPGALVGDQVNWKLTAVDGPGTVAVYQTDQFGAPTVLFNSNDGLPDATTIAAGGDVHGNWAFSAAGRYTLTVEVDATLADSTPVASGPVDLDVVVGHYTCADIDDVTLAPTSVTAGGNVAITRTLTNCGAETRSFGVKATVFAPTACGGGSQVFTLSGSALNAGQADTKTNTITAPTCAGTHTVRVKAGNTPNSYAQLKTLVVT